MRYPDAQSGTERTRSLGKAEDGTNYTADLDLTYSCVVAGLVGLVALHARLIALVVSVVALLSDPSE